MRAFRAGSCLAALAALIAFAAPILAQSQVAATPSVHSGPFYYDVSKEITLSGTIADVVKKPTKSMVMGSHLIVQTPSGTVDASLGRFAFQGRSALAVVPGQPVQLTGVLKTIKGQPVLLTRSVKVDDQIFVIRNERGHGISARSRERQGQSSGQKGGLL
jgi:hypothetical protein